MKDRILYALAAVILVSCFYVGVRIIFDVLHAIDCAPNAERNGGTSGAVSGSGPF